MKTLIIISALVYLAIAAPTNNEHGIDAVEESPGNLPEYTREKKSAQDFFLSPSTTFALPGLDTQPEHLKDETNGPEARSHFSYKGPIVVKKKSGYHVYRDSEEERDADDQGENCNKQLRVKLCNEDITGKSTNKRNTGIHNDDVESTIQIAREAIDILRRDMKNLEQRVNGKTENLENNVPSSLDKNIHQKIENVREALRRVENLKAINMQPKNKEKEIINDLSDIETEHARLTQWKEATQHKDIVDIHAKALSDVSKSNFDSERGRLAQWKEVTQNKETHTKPFEDITKSRSQEHRFAQWKDVFPEKDAKMPNKALDDIAVPKTDEQRLAQWKDAIENSYRHAEVPRNLENSFKSGEHQSEMRKSANLGATHDMSSAASEQISTKVEYDNHIQNKQLTKYEKSSEIPNSALTHHLKEKDQPLSEIKIKHQSHDIHSKNAETKWEFHGNEEKDVGEKTQHKDVFVFMKNADQTNTNFKNTENDNHKITESIKTRHSVLRSNNDPTSLSETSNLSDAKMNHKDFHGKSAESKGDLHSHGNQHYKDVYIFMKNAEQSDKVTLNTENNHQDTKTFSDSEIAMQGKHAEPLHAKHIQHKHTGYVPIKAPHHHHYVKEMKHLPKYYGHYSKHGKSADSDGPSARYGASPKPVPHIDDMHSGHGHLSMYKPHGADIHSEHGFPMQKPHIQDPHHHYHGNTHHSHYPMHGKSSELDAFMQPSDLIHMNDFLGKSALENIQWKDHIQTARGSYGAPSYGGYSSYNIASSGGADAYGLFPKVKSECAVPLLLNCSPTVVHGKLVKSYSNYAEPHYRSEDDFHLQQKREIIKESDNTNNKIISNMNYNKYEPEF